MPVRLPRLLATSAAGLLLVAMTAAHDQGGAVGVRPVVGAAGTSEGTGAISGIVIDGATNQPLAGALVFLRDREKQAGQVTDPKGRFLFAGLPAYEGYAIRVLKFGYLDAYYGTSSSVGDTSSRSIALLDRQWVRDIRVVMTKPGSIAGAVRDSRGEPIVGAAVRVLTQLRIAGHLQLASGLVVRTDDRGFYRLPKLPPGRYYVQMLSAQHAMTTSARRSSGDSGERQPSSSDLTMRIDEATELVLGRYPVPPRAPDGRLMVYPVTFFPAARDINGASTVDLAAGEDRSDVNVDVATVSGVRISGVLTGVAKSLVGLSVRLLLPGTEDLGDGGEAATSLVGDDGRFAFVNVPAGSYVIDARGKSTQFETTMSSPADRLPPPPGAARSGSFGVSAAPSGTWVSYRLTGGLDYWGLQDVVADGDVVDTVVTMRRAATFSGRYAWEGPRRTTPGGVVMAQPANGAASLGVVVAQSDSKDPDSFTIQGLLPGRYVLTATPVMIAQGARVKSVVCGDRDYVSSVIDTTSQADFPGCLVTLTSVVTEVSGTVRDGQNRVTREAAVLMFPAESAQWADIGLTPARVKCLQVASDGSYRFRTLPAGDYLAIAIPLTAMEDWLDPQFFQRAAAAATRVRLDWGVVAAQNLTVVSAKPSR